LFPGEFDLWRTSDIDVGVTVDAAGRGWTGSVGLVTKLLDQRPIRYDSVTSFLCGPEIMMRNVARTLTDRGADPTTVMVSLERNMHCAVRLCGHCQLGPRFICSEGPVLSWADASPLLGVRRW
jgi:NAD(P)H-flavin reductase